MPIITLEVMSHRAHINKNPVDGTTQTEIPTQDSDAMHFLPENNDEATKSDEKDERESFKSRTDLLEYMMRNDGSVVCKLCGEILQSRTHWYRHKYKLHVVQPMNPAPLFQCEVCLVYFKSRKGYIGHLASRHSEVLSDAYPVLSNSQTETVVSEKIPIPQEVKEESEETNSPAPTTSPATQSNLTTKSQRSSEGRRLSRSSKDTNNSDWEEKRSKEEKLVADIIDRVRRECEAQGIGSARKGYTRRTAMQTRTSTSASVND